MFLNNFNSRTFIEHFANIFHHLSLTSSRPVETALYNFTVCALHNSSIMQIDLMRFHQNLCVLYWTTIGSKIYYFAW